MWDKATKEDFKNVRPIVQRVVKQYPTIDYMSLEMDIIAIHVSGCKLRLKELSQADDLNFFHDVFGIVKNLDRDTGKLQNYFLPRYSA